MMRLGVAVAIALSFCSVAPMASAQEHHWHTIVAAGDPNITMEIPVGIDQNASATKNGLLMAVVATSGDNSDMVCILKLEEYSGGATQKLSAEWLSSSNIGVFCGNSRGDEKDMGSQSKPSNGFSAGTCLSSYTDSTQEKPGIFKSITYVAATRGLYALYCTANSKDESTAIWDWEVNWEDIFSHMQASLHLPDSKK
jgi:hypothetical protein